MNPQYLQKNKLLNTGIKIINLFIFNNFYDRIGTSLRDSFNANKVPGSGSYNPNFTDRPKTPSYRIGTDVRKPLNDQTKTPGPGTYQLPHRGIEGP